MMMSIRIHPAVYGLILQWLGIHTFLFQKLFFGPEHFHETALEQQILTPSWRCWCLGDSKPHQQPYYCRADYRFAPSQWETALLCNDVSHWMGANLESIKMVPLLDPLHMLFSSFPALIIRPNKNILIFITWIVSVTQYDKDTVLWHLE